MTINHYAYAGAKNIHSTVGAIYGLTDLLHKDECRAANAGEDAVFGPYERGVIYDSIQELAARALELAETIEEEEKRLAELEASREEREAKQ